MTRRPISADVQLKIRIKESLRRHLAAEAKANGVSLNAETARRLKESFLFGPPHITAECLKIATIMAVVERTAGKPLTDAAAFAALRTAVWHVLGFGDSTVELMPLQDVKGLVK